MNFERYNISSYHRNQLIEEEMWINEEDEWLDYGSSSSDDDEPFDIDDKMNEDDIKDKDELYNSKADDRDAKWMEKLTKHLKGTERKSDAILTCASCFTFISADCQRHSSHANQFRAMFVRNCRVNKEEEIRYRKNEEIVPQLSRKRQKALAFKERKKILKTNREKGIGNVNIKEEKEEESEEKEKKEKVLLPYEFADKIMENDEHLFESETYLLAYCSNCDAEVGVRDLDEVYHLYNVIPSDT
eukprot:TRINITY_DN2713_c0_g1_i1.p1 TRINITY_DN2713_c0_g1~~TRINITY_DN2713_c0_g1_i1.p1  ORF type:complete len:244 (+),score=78.06 TRINITY_DN2713_c0_g1_i1:299-1030(+)